MAAIRARAAAVPAWAWLTAIVVVSSAIRIELGRRMIAPWIMSDELIYSELAKSFAAHGHFLVRGVPSHGYGFVYPVVIAPAWRLFSSVPTAYTAAKTINGVVMSLAAIPAYFLARRLMASGLALVVAALTVAIPSMLYTATLMTENVFYPIFLVVVLALVAMLEKPTWQRQLTVLVLCGLAYLTRAQAVALVPAAVIAPILLAAFERRLRSLRAYWPLYGTLVGGGLLALLDTVARGRSVTTLLGAYKAATAGSYTVNGVLHYLLWHVSELDLSLGIIPFAALLALWLAPRDVSPAARVFAAASLPVVVLLVIEVAIFASVNSDRVEERNMFYVAPLALIALVGLAADGVVSRRARVLLPAALIAALLPFFLPFARLIGPPVVSDTFALLPWWWIQDQGIHLNNLRWAAIGASIPAAALFVYLPRRFALGLAALVGIFFIASSAVVENGRHGIVVDSVGSLWAGIKVPHRNWIDRAVGPNAQVDYLWSGTASVYSIWENEIFNRSFRNVLNLEGPGEDTLPETAVQRSPTGEVVADGHVVRAQYVLADGSADVRGTKIGEDKGVGLDVELYRVNGPIVILSHVIGIDPGGTWSRRNVTYTRVDCTGGRLDVTLSSDPSLYRSNQTVTARERGAVVGSATIAPTATVQLTVPLRQVHGRCTVHFETAKTVVPARVEKGSTDTRPLGAHFTFAYTS
jgi:Dolichyl-phosphate-mannose-protein mannosyltransferase